MKAILRRIRISSKKVNLAASLVRTKNALEAIDILRYTPKKSAKILKKVIQSAIANAENNNKQDKKKLYIKEIVVTEGPTYKRSIPVSRGRANPRLKRTANITVKLETSATSATGKSKHPEHKEVKETETKDTTKVKAVTKKAKTTVSPKEKKKKQRK